MLTPVARGCHVAGPRLIDLARNIDVAAILTRVATRELPPIARRMGCVMQLGTLEGDMVTYRVKAGGELFTQVGMQLEAYCSAIGKVLLANLSEADRRRYLDGGPFVGLTANTITDPVLLSREFEVVQRLGYACDDEEVCDGLACIAVPVRDGQGVVIAAISVSKSIQRGRSQALHELLPSLIDARDLMERQMNGCRPAAKAVCG